MATFVALLRAVNVGGTGTLQMTDLRAIAEEAGLEDARTYIQSGNLVFRSDRGPEAIKAALEDGLRIYAGKPVEVVLRTAAEMRTVLDANPFPDAAPNRIGVLFLDGAPSRDSAEEAKGCTDEEIVLGDREVFVHYPSGMGRSRLRMRTMAKGTVRNLNTVAKLVALATQVEE